MWLYFANKEKNVFLRYFYKKAAKYLLLERARIYKSGRSWVGVPIEIDYEQLKADCQLETLKVNHVTELLSLLIVWICNIIKKYPLEKKCIEIKIREEST